MFRRSGKAKELRHIFFNHVIENCTHNSSNVWLTPDLGQHVLSRPSPIKRGAYRHHICASQYGIQVEHSKLRMDKNLERSPTKMDTDSCSHCWRTKWLTKVSRNIQTEKLLCECVCWKREKGAGWFADFRLPHTYKSSNALNSLSETTLKPASEKCRAAIVIL